MHKTKTLILLALLISCFSSFAQMKHSLLWEISGNGLERPSYLFGTIHAICPDQFELPPKVETALAKTEQLVLELDMDDPALMQEMQVASMNPNMENLSSKFEDADLTALNALLLDHYQADMSQFGVFKPFVLVALLAVTSFDCPNPTSLEGVLMKKAKLQGQEVKGMETVQEQLDIFEQASSEEQLNWILQYVRNEEANREDTKKLIEAYQAEQIDQLLLLGTDYPEYKNIEEALLYERNEKWISSIGEMANDKPTFFAVGAAHLASERGLIELLGAQGYELTPILE